MGAEPTKLLFDLLSQLVRFSSSCYSCHDAIFGGEALWRHIKSLGGQDFANCCIDVSGAICSRDHRLSSNLHHYRNDFRYLSGKRILRTVHLVDSGIPTFGEFPKFIAKL